jgi:hypothetical protein
MNGACQGGSSTTRCWSVRRPRRVGTSNRSVGAVPVAPWSAVGSSTTRFLDDAVLATNATARFPGHGPGRGRRVAATNSTAQASAGAGRRTRRGAGAELDAVLASEGGRGASTSGHDRPFPCSPTPGHELDDAVLVVELDGAVPRPRMEIDARLPRIAYNATNPVRRPKAY